MRVFFSWQSDVKYNKTIIGTALEGAIGQLCKDYHQHGIKIYSDDATRNIPGAPDIYNEILQKINESEIFIADVTPIVPNKKIANSNVMFELGYAISILGQYRVILLFNKKNGNIDDNLPFDIAKKRITLFSADDINNKSDVGSLQKTLYEAIKSIVDKNPPKNINLNNDVKRDRDIASIKWIFAQAFPLKIWDSFFDQYPSAHCSEDILLFWETFTGMYNSSYWYFYDDLLRKQFEIFASNIDYVFENASKLIHSNYKGFLIPSHDWSSDDDKLFYDTVNRCTMGCRAYKKIIEHIRKTYIDIDLDDLSAKAISQHMQIKEQIKRRMK